LSFALCGEFSFYFLEHPSKTDTVRSLSCRFLFVNRRDDRATREKFQTLVLVDHLMTDQTDSAYSTSITQSHPDRTTSYEFWRLLQVSFVFGSILFLVFRSCYTVYWTTKQREQKQKNNLIEKRASLSESNDNLFAECDELLDARASELTSRLTSQKRSRIHTERTPSPYPQKDHGERSVHFKELTV